MVCNACKIGVHTGNQGVLMVQTANSWIYGKKLSICKGGTWCDCQHRTDVSRPLTTDLR